MKVVVKNLKNKKVKDLDLPEAVFAYPYKEHLIHTAVQAFLAERRSGTHSAKGRAEVQGSGRKLWRQKGTGRARVGNARNPIRRGGGAAHGPRPRSYASGLSARERRGALKSALSQKLKDDGILILEALELESHRTKDLEASLVGLGVEGKALLVDDRENSNLMMAARNNPRLKAVDALAVSVYDVIDRSSVVLTEQALGRIVEVLSK